MVEHLSNGTEIWTRDLSKRGITTGAQHKCKLMGCRGMRVAVRWADGRITFPCSEGIIANNGKWIIS